VKKKLVAFDADGVLVNYDKGFHKWMRGKYGIELDYANRPTYGLYQTYPEKFPTIDDELKMVHEFGMDGGMATLERFCPFLDEVINRDDVVVLSRFPEWQRLDRYAGLKAAVGLRYASKIFGVWEQPKPVVLERLATKFGVALDDVLMIDDLPHHIPEFGQGILVAQSYNENPQFKPTQRAVRVDPAEVIDHVKEFLR
jgi:FMN phosphatase YigB (HAD superfamily)